MADKQLILMRHAKSSWKYPLPDVDRPLNARGMEAAPFMGQRLARRGVCVDCIITSHAVRALRTAQAVAKALAYPVEAVQLQPRLYTEDPLQVLRVITELDDAHESVMLVGHNPAFTALANRFADAPIINVPTAGVVWLEVEAPHWRDVHVDQVQLVDFDYPKRLAG